MSRSIHTTHKTIKALRDQDFSDKAAKADTLKKSRKQIRKKRRIKRRVIAERKRETAPLAATAIETIPIQVCDDAPFVHHGASPLDIRAVFDALPEEAVQGISRIQLSLGKQYIDEFSEDEHAERDPISGRLGYLLFPGVYMGEWYGTFSPRSGLISIYAFVVDKAALPLPRALCEIYLRLSALSTLVHEIAHHYDETRRIGRGRWLADRTENVERYAEKMEAEWTRSVVLPYLRMAYPRETKILSKWVAHYGGLDLNLESFAGDHGYAFQKWLGRRPRSSSRAVSRHDFAWELHLADHYDECLKIVDALLVQEPNSHSALLLKTHTLLDLKRADEAFDCAERMIQIDPINHEGWTMRGQALALKRNWAALLAHCDSWAARQGLTERSRENIHVQRAVSHCALGNEEEMLKNLRASVAIWPHREQAADRWLYYAAKAAHYWAGKPLPDSWKPIV